ncbi:MAG TPA: glycoside hydrolase family 2 TIM barrel-domain containing protein [Thermoanaerobaculia bacterium]|nr:glycoside hydrolase family 2 TIM barrel-domain containing protein [Thermoanaerobaculia bacterium]
MLLRLPVALALVVLVAPVRLPAGSRPSEEGVRPAAPVTERLDLSGPDAADPRPWGFRVSSGARAGEHATIPVPSQWELHGFGTYAYGQQDDPPAEEGFYSLDFEVPAHWSGRRLELVFEGAMTDTSVELNGASAGPVHRGGFTRFGYDVTSLVRVGGSNRLEVTVRERSANRSVEAAEREADYWIFGGIYRPVYLDAHPAASIDHVAIEARADGVLRALVETVGSPPGARLLGRVTDEDGEELAQLTASVDAEGRAELATTVAGARTWSHEHPHLHHLELLLESAGGEPLHRVRQRFGFRTLEIRLDGPRPGLYVNGIRTLLRGVNRHSFRPESGRALSAAQNRADAERIRALHFNAVRASHYPPDVAFLEACDELGLYVIDELPGWHDAYDDEVGAALVAALVRRDVNHPSIVLWANGNEGGWNPALDGLYAEHDPQARPVIHPWDDFGGLDTGHYPSWRELIERLDDSPRGLLPWRRRSPRSLVLPTEALHGLFDGGGGASLGRYWSAISSARRGAGIFLWALIDEGVVRVDRGGEVDLFGNYAPDGILDPWRRAEPSARAVREIFAPVRVVETAVDPDLHLDPDLLDPDLLDPDLLDPDLPDPAAAPASARGGEASVTIHLENRFTERSLADVTIAWRVLRLPGPFEDATSLEPLAAGELPGPDAAPGNRGAVRVPWTDGAGALEVVATLPAAKGRPQLEVARAVLPVAPVASGRTSSTASSAGSLANGSAEDSRPAQTDVALVLTRGGTRLLLDPASGELIGLERDGRRLPLAGGARSTSGARPSVRATRFTRRRDRDAIEVAYESGFRRAVWSVGDDGAVELSWIGEDDGTQPFAGILFDYPRERVESVTWLGGGPFAVWGNRLEGADLGLWTAPSAATAERIAVPLEGVRSGVRWARLDTADGELVIVPRRDPRRPAAAEPFLGLYRPVFPEGVRGARAELPEGIAILHRIPPIGSKFHDGHELVAPERRDPTILQGRVTLLWRPAAPPGAPSSPAPPE